jgi:uncharacterized protein (TIGR03437 family)
MKCFWVALLPLLTGVLGAQQSRIGSIDASRTVVLRGHIRPEARAEFDRGAVEAGFVLPAVTLHLKPSASQQRALEQLLTEQQDLGSANFHKWLTPEQYADRFGVSREDLEKITAWLRSEGFKVSIVARGRTWVTFTGTAEQAKNAFHVDIHRYDVKGIMHTANANDPALPAALAGMVLGFQGLSDFKLKPRLVKSKAAFNEGGTHYLAPDDFATIYDAAKLYTAGIDGSGQSLVIVGQTDIKIADINQFRSQFLLPAINLQQILVPGQTDPGVSDAYLLEADLDLEWSGAVARNAKIIYVNSNDAFMSLQYAVDQNLAPVASMSYGSCEASDMVDLPTYQQVGQQANAQGITWLAAAGDTGAADCDGTDPAENGFAVDGPGSTPEVTSMGGTEFVDGGGNYWSSSNSSTGASALSYIPERVWNDTSEEGSLAAGGGGGSIYFAQPSWQTGTGVPTDGVRHVPDLALNASNYLDTYYYVSNGFVGGVGGTSAAAPTMAGIVALLNQYVTSTGAQSQAGLGNINPALYRMAAKTPSAFHDVTQGDNIVPCAPGTPNCTNGQFGFSAGTGYDQGSGLGSPDVYNFVHAWTSALAVNSAVVASIDQNPVFQQAADGNGNQWAYTLTLTEAAGVGTTLTTFTINGKSADIVSTFGSASIPAHGSISSKNLGFATLAVPTNVTFGFSGMDASGQAWSQTLTVPFDGPQVQLTVGGAGNAASGQQAYAPGMIVSIYGTAMGDFAQAAAAIPLPEYLAGAEAWVNNVPAALYYVAPGQMNIQIPYETSPGQMTLTVGNPYVNVNYNINVTAAAPGIFGSEGMVAAPFSSAARGQTSTIFITGEGQVTPALADGTTPDPSTPVSRLPKPMLPVTMTVGGQPASISFIGIPSGFVGVTQINYVVPANAPVGVQAVVVTVGTVASPPAKLNVQ